jgi:hypothetical protein
MNIIDETRDKLKEYGIEIFSEYPLNDFENGEYLFMADNMMLFVHSKNNEIGISFQAETRPRSVANSLLIILEIDSDIDIDIMESFVVDENKHFVSGEKAFEIINKKNQYQAMNEVFKDQVYSELLLNGTAGEC